MENLIIGKIYQDLEIKSIYSCFPHKSFEDFGAFMLILDQQLVMMPTGGLDTISASLGAETTITMECGGMLVGIHHPKEEESGW